MLFFTATLCSSFLAEPPVFLLLANLVASPFRMPWPLYTAHIRSYRLDGVPDVQHQYRHFIQVLQNATKSTTTPALSQEWKSLAQNKTFACITNFTGVTNDTFSEYPKEGGTGKIT
ncbi:hypothetical protein DFH07DRAFT_775188 [Mycena maculata]|uniref:Uncharacterized protein n=1 Tax=Mycena maculata TaxID=230809 RepID=A0AAD7IT64_9AGAR|nr:hypothetical protein DFH07DRAFT_775188 [Mycena maculata]